MARGRGKPGADEAESREGGAPAIGGNVTDARMRQFEREYVAAKAKIDEARGALGVLCKAAETDGIDVKVFKQVRKLKDLLPPEMDAKIQTFTRYTQQLGLFEAIEQYRQEVNNEDNAASVRAAERDAARQTKRTAMAPADAGELTKSGGKLEAAHAQGLEAGMQGAARGDNPYPRLSDERDCWDRGWKHGDDTRHFRAPGAEPQADARA